MRGEIGNWKLGRNETSKKAKSWLRKLIRRKVLSESNATEYEAIIEKLGPKLNAFINSTKT
ncbi:MAG: hypothetical protein C4B57_08685 [Deltaproteobacteria bacterium]|nr:MAG: hypothetical protein C4B57_08685 [Deltaproteobacteria bacterium]